MIRRRVLIFAVIVIGAIVLNESAWSQAVAISDDIPSTITATAGSMNSLRAATVSADVSLRAAASDNDRDLLAFSYGLMIGANLAEAPTPALSILGSLIRRYRRRVVQSVVEPACYPATAANNADIGLWLWKPSENKVWMNPHCRRLVGTSEHMAVEFDLFIRLIAGHRGKTTKDAMVQTILSSGTFQSEFRLLDAENRTLWLLVTGKSVKTGADLSMTGTMLDISEYKMAHLEVSQLRQQVIHLTRVATLGELSGALAHELNQPLTAILTNAQTGQRLVNRSQVDTAEIRDILSDIIDDDRRAGAVLNKLRNLIRNEHVDFVEIDLNQIVSEVLSLVHSELIERRIDVATDLSCDLPKVRGDHIQIQQVLINFIRNACDAMGGVRRQPHRLVLKTTRQQNGTSAVIVTDSGSGIAADLRNRLFEPFVTSKPQGMGLGLAISRSIMSAHGGAIWCDENPNGGAIFGIALPVFERRPTWAT
jgi:signal transduction histidine kinase